MRSYQSFSFRPSRSLMQSTTRVSRRALLQQSALIGAGLGLGSSLWSQQIATAADAIKRSGKRCILLWMQGGPSQFETFDPKPGKPTGGETKAIATNVSGIHYSENLPYLAKQADQWCVLRSMTSKEGSHPRAQSLMHTGYLPAVESGIQRWEVMLRIGSK